MNRGVGLGESGIRGRKRMVYRLNLKGSSLNTGRGTGNWKLDILSEFRGQFDK